MLKTSAKAGVWVKVAAPPATGAGRREIAPAAQSSVRFSVNEDVTSPAAPGLVLAAELTKLLLLKFHNSA